MPKHDKPMQQLLDSLKERAKELSCLYRVDEILADSDRSLSQVCQDLADALPPGWQYPGETCARVRLREFTSTTRGFQATSWSLRSPIVQDEVEIGEITVYYTQEKPLADEGPFLKDERKLLDSIAERVAFYITRRNLRKAHASLAAARALTEEPSGAEWGIILDFLRRTDPELLRRITRRLINHLGLSGIPQAQTLLRKFFQDTGDSATLGDNVPLRRVQFQDLAELSEEAFATAARYLGEEELVTSIRTWMDEERSGNLIENLEDQGRPLSQIVEAIGRHRGQIGEDAKLSVPARRTLSAALLRRLFSDELDYINVARDFVGLEDIYDLVNHIIYPAGGYGKLGGKCAGLFLATWILRREDSPELLRKIKVPRAWYVTSDVLVEFLNYNDLRELYFRKYMDIERVRQEYPRIIQMLKNSRFPPEISRGLAFALDDFEGRPIIVRSSSLLEDRAGSSFAGKYKSLFLANRGTRQERLTDLEDAIAEIYASVFSPDPIEYRVDRGLIDVHEEMGIMIQEVVGHTIGHYFLPAFAGVAMSDNEFRWSPRITRRDGLVRMVAGLGTRAVDRVGDDYPVLLSPGQPGLRVNVTPDEVTRYSPRWIDVIDLETNTLRTVSVQELLRECGEDYPAIRRIVSIVEENRIRKPIGLEPDFDTDEVVVTFSGLLEDTTFVRQMGLMLQELRSALGRPVDLEFASDGTDLYLLQCRTQSAAGEYAPAAIPPNLPKDLVLFSAHGCISNGRVPDISHIVYVDPERYAALDSVEQLREVGQAVGRLNKLLPRRQFILMGPGRWGSRGDIRLGVPVTYADLSNTAVLMEIARRKGNYVPELSFGTHFFQDLVEAEIRYIPLHPEEGESRLNERFLRRAQNILPEILPEHAPLSDTLRVIDIAREAEGRVLRILMNADLDQAVGLLDLPRAGDFEAPRHPDMPVQHAVEAHWRWRLRMAERIALELDPDRFGVKALYVIGSVKNATAGPSSDIDLLVHVEDDPNRREHLQLWLEGWSQSLAEMNYLRTGYQSPGLLDVHYLTDEDMEQRTSYAVKIGAVTDAARPLPLGRRKA